MTRSRTNHRTRTIALLLMLLMASVTVAGCSSPASLSGSGSTADQAPVARDQAVAPASPEMSTGAPKGAANEAASGSDASAPTASTPAANRLVVVNKTMRLQIADVDKVLQRVRDLAAKAGGEIESQQVSSSSDEPIYPQPLPADAAAGRSATPVRAVVTVRVPTAGYRAFVDEAAKLGKVLFQSETSQDVTQQHVDMKARLGNLKAEQVRLRQLFARAGTIKEMLEVERELSRVQGEIESMQAQLDYLDRQAAMATVTLELQEPKQIVRPTGTDWGVGTAFTTSIRAFVSTMNGLIVILGPALALLVFFVLPLALIVLIVVRTLNRRRARRAAGASVPGEDSRA